MTEIYVLDTETTGLGGGFEGDVVVEIGIARVDLEKRKVYPEFGCLVCQNLSDEQKEAWVFKNTDLTPEEVEKSPWTIEEIRHVLLRYENRVFTAYNVVFDFDSFLQITPWFFRPKLAPCIKEECANRYNDGRWFKAQEAYDMLCPDNPARVPNGKEEHRALSDAVLEGYILLRLCEKNPDIEKKYLEAAGEE